MLNNYGGYFGNLTMLIFFLLLNNRWELVGSTNFIQYSPFPIPEHGLQARFKKEI